MGRRPHLLPSLLSAALLVGALAEHPYSYFTWLRWIVCITAVMVAWVGYEARKPAVTVLFSVVAVLFNPLLPFFMERQTWLPVDLLAAAMFIYSTTVREPEGVPPPEAPTASKRPHPGVAPGTAATAPRVVQEALLRRVDVVPEAEEVPALGDPEGLFAMGSTLEDATNPTDLRLVRSIHERAATMGEPASMVSLVRLLMHDEPPDVAGARLWAERAADEGFVDGLITLGVMLLSKVDPRDEVAAQSVFDLAAELAGGDAIMSIVQHLVHLDPPDLERARSWASRSKSEGYSEGFVDIAWRLEGYEGGNDTSGARTMYESAASMGDAEAIWRLVGLLLSDVEPPDVQEALKWADRAAAAGDPEPYFTIGFLLETGTDPPDLRVARSAYERAARLGHAAAAHRLATLPTVS